MKKLSIFIVMLISIHLGVAQDAKTLYKEAKKLSKEKKHEEAIDKLSQAISKDNENYSALLLRAESYAALKNYQQALIDYKIAAKEYPKKKSVQFETGKMFFLLGNYSESVPYFEKVLEIDPEYIPGLTYGYKSMYYAKSYAQAKTTNDKAIEEDKENAEHFYFQGLIGLKQKDYPTAEKGLVECAKINNQYKGVYTALAQVRLERKVYDKVPITCDFAIKNDPKDEEAYYIKAIAQDKLNKLSSSIATLTTLINIDGVDKSKALYQRGMYYLKSEDLMNAKRDFTSSIKNNEKYTIAYNQRALIYEQQEDLKLAANDYEKIIEINGNSKEEQKLIENARQRIFEINKESNPPKISLIGVDINDQNTISVKANQPKQELKIQIEDNSLIESILIDGKEAEYDKKILNPLVKYTLDVSKTEHIRVDVEDIYSNKSSETFHFKLKKINPPKIALTEPYASTNGETYVDKDVKDLFVEGKITHSEKIASIKVNNIPASYLHDKLNPSFSAKIDVSNLTKFSIEVEGEFGTKTVKEYNLVRTEVTANNPMGKTWVVFIENSNYQNFSSLEGPTKDINLIKTSLADYSIHKIIHKKDMGKDELARFFSIELRDLIKKNRVNSLMVWYAGHGKFVNETGYWIPTDAKRDEEYSYYNINTLRASMQSYDNILVHNLVITDACESGPSFYLAMRDTPKERVCGDWEATKFRSAQVLSSAGYELAVDNSQFTKTFANMLDHNPNDCIPIEKISNKVVEVVSQTGNQKPSLGKIKGLSDQNGTFFFIKK